MHIVWNLKNKNKKVFYRLTNKDLLLTPWLYGSLTQLLDYLCSLKENEYVGLRTLQLPSYHVDLNLMLHWEYVSQ